MDSLLRKSKKVYAYDENFNFLGEYKSLNDVALKLRTPKSTVMSALDVKIINPEKKSCKSKSIYSKYLDKNLIFRTTLIPN